MREKLMTKKQVADILSVSVRSVERLAARGELKIVKIGGCVRFRHKEIEEIIERGMNRNDFPG